MASANTVSRFLGKQFDRSPKEDREGFTACAGDDEGTVFVDLTIGSSNWHLSRDAQMARIETMATQYTEYLGARWDVRRHPLLHTVLVISDRSVAEAEAPPEALPDLQPREFGHIFQRGNRTYFVYDLVGSWRVMEWLDDRDAEADLIVIDKTSRDEAVRDAVALIDASHRDHVRAARLNRGEDPTPQGDSAFPDLVDVDAIIAARPTGPSYRPLPLDYGRPRIVAARSVVDGDIVVGGVDEFDDGWHVDWLGEPYEADRYEFDPTCQCGACEDVTPGESMVVLTPDGHHGPMIACDLWPADRLVLVLSPATTGLDRP